MWARRLRSGSRRVQCCPRLEGERLLRTNRPSVCEISIDEFNGYGSTNERVENRWCLPRAHIRAQLFDDNYVGRSDDNYLDRLSDGLDTGFLQTSKALVWQDNHSTIGPHGIPTLASTR